MKTAKIAIAMDEKKIENIRALLKKYLKESEKWKS